MRRLGVPPVARRVRGERDAVERDARLRGVLRRVVVRGEGGDRAGRTDEAQLRIEGLVLLVEKTEDARTSAWGIVSKSQN